jgi:hypothetical protein
MKVLLLQFPKMNHQFLKSRRLNRLIHRMKQRDHAIHRKSTNIHEVIVVVTKVPHQFRQTTPLFLWICQLTTLFD